MWVDTEKFVIYYSHSVCKGSFILVGRTLFLLVLTFVGTSSMSMAVLLLLLFSFWFDVSIGRLVFIVVVNL